MWDSTKQGHVLAKSGKYSFTHNTSLSENHHLSLANISHLRIFSDLLAEANDLSGIFPQLHSFLGREEVLLLDSCCGPLPQLLHLGLKLAHLGTWHAMIQHYTTNNGLRI